MYIESWTTTTFDGETFQQMTTTGSEGLDVSIGLTTEARQPWFLLDSIKEFKFQQTMPTDDDGTIPTDRLKSCFVYPRGV